MTLTFDLLSLELVRNVSRSMDNRPANFGVSLSSYGQTCIRLSTWPYDLDLWPFDL